MITFGLTGGIACGKSTATNMIKSLGIPMVDADLISRKVVEPNTIGWQQVYNTFGPNYFSNGLLLRSKLGELVFSDAAAMSALNEIMKPLIVEEAELQINMHHAQGNFIVGYDSALLIESGEYLKYKPLLVVSCPLEIQICRLMKRSAVSREYAEIIIANQMTSAEKEKFADFVIDTSLEKEKTEKQVLSIINKLYELEDSNKI